MLLRMQMANRRIRCGKFVGIKMLRLLLRLRLPLGSHRELIEEHSETPEREA